MLKHTRSYTVITLGLTLAILLIGVTGMTLFARLSDGGVGEVVLVKGDTDGLIPFSFSNSAKEVSFPPLERYDVNACVSFWVYTDTRWTDKPEVFQQRKQELFKRQAELGHMSRELFEPYHGLSQVARLIIELAGYRSADQQDGAADELLPALADRIQIDRDTKTFYLQDFVLELDGIFYSVDLVCSMANPFGAGEAGDKTRGDFYFKCTPTRKEQDGQPSAMWKQLRFAQICDEFYQDMKIGEKFKLDVRQPEGGIYDKLKTEENPLSAFFLVFHSMFSDLLSSATGGQIGAEKSGITREPACTAVAGDGLHYYVQQWAASESTLVLMCDPVTERVEGVSIY